ncbi:putative cell wall protein RHD3 [Rosellinia necatrix]|uniref:Putative cell wall protein RHD3 n=1 Tax=Rosellinia necatrix TaxID=77044 RepID=A0A1W2TP92_ROSNE|nr:putative cell wall protein RHD3 [Rosellinia necatrix]
MKSQITTVVLRLGIAATATAQLLQEGPFALRVKGQARNSSIDGFLHTVDLGPALIQKPIQYEPISAPPAGNETYEFWFNYTGFSQSRGYDVGFFLTDPTLETVADSGFYGRAMSMLYSAGSNVAFPVVGAGAAIGTGVDSDNKTFVNIYFDDSTYVPNEPPVVGDGYDFYNWAICWQFFGRVYMPSLSWLTYGPYHNPTCEAVDLIRVAL